MYIYPKKQGLRAPRKSTSSFQITKTNIVITDQRFFAPFSQCSTADFEPARSNGNAILNCLIKSNALGRYIQTTSIAFAHGSYGHRW
mmetsp:Transcript_11418/g.15089  ORF Transcript_11418/g.15089 Transcript_11418/m.15089 type:complete len:87 (+) Transcript_11418:407-667(+)